ncbi:hypothetical protein DM01DRAFT_1408888 [Hesseltinella vesiculosa]|uniref:Thioredoxin domain-containing protein n=1 Tax=Hesseltinella vesiculosa TaxID=101127 RepID=A0A1X2GCX5_9FUNG|nr:hypothetical protein DM01DRAFT_1408888 [Hesseltinella vesiculosa]
MVSRLWTLSVCFSLFAKALAFISLNESQVKTKTANNHWLILYTATNDLADQWQSFSDNYSDWQSFGVYFGQVDCNKEACPDFDQAQFRLFSEGALVNTVDATKNSWQPVLEQHILSSPISRSIPINDLDTLTRIKESTSSWFIKFYAPWCGHCKNLAPVWENLAMEQASSPINLGEVNCETQRDICAAENVGGLPTLAFYNRGHRFVYNGKRELDSFKTYVKKMTGPAFEVVSYDALAKIQAEPVSLVYIHSPKDTNLEAIEQVAVQGMDKLPVYVTADKKIDKELKGAGKLPRLVMIKHGGQVQSVNDGPSSTWADWVDSHKYPLVTTLASHNANEVLKGKRLVALYLTANEQTDAGFLAVSLDWESSGYDLPVTFAQLNAKQWSTFVKRVYNVDAKDLPGLVVLDPKKKLYFKEGLNGEGFTTTQPEALFAALQHTDELHGQTTDVPRGVSIVQKILVFVGDHGLKITLVMLGLSAIVFYINHTRQPQGTNMPIQPTEDDDHEKKD